MSLPAYALHLEPPRAIILQAPLSCTLASLQRLPGTASGESTPNFNCLVGTVMTVIVRVVVVLVGVVVVSAEGCTRCAR